MALTVLLSLAKIFGYILSPAIIFLYRCVSRRKRPEADFTDDIVLVTGAAQGLGKEIAMQFSARGGVVVLWDIEKSTLEDTRAQIASKGGQVFAYVVDCSKREEVYDAARRVKEEVGNVSVLVNNAGVVHPGSILDTKDEHIEKTYSINTTAYYWTLRSFLPWMVENNYGYVVNIVSVVAFTGFTNYSTYCSSKAAAFSLSESLKFELYQSNKTGVSVTAVCPWSINNTKMFEGFHTTIHWLIPSLLTTDIAKKILRATYDRQFYLVIPSVMWILILLKLLIPSKAASEFVNLLKPASKRPYQ